MIIAFFLTSLEIAGLPLVEVLGDYLRKGPYLTVRVPSCGGVLGGICFCADGHIAENCIFWKDKCVAGN